MGRLRTATGLFIMAAVVSACAGTDALDGAPSGGGIIGGSTPPAAGGGVSSGTGQGAAAVVTDARIYFAPVIGATEQAVPPLSNQLRQRAAARGITIVPQEDGSAHVVKGYFSAFTDGGQTTVIYVWDVLDPAGNRLHRIQGQERVPAGSADGWASVTDATMQAIADTTVDQITAWLAQRQA